MIEESSLGKMVVARFSDKSISAVGQCVTYCGSPTVTIRRMDGTQMHWRADMCEEIPLVPDVAAELERMVPK